MKAVLFLSALLSLGVSALPEPDNAVITEGDYTYKGIDKTARQANVNVLATTAAGHATVVELSVSQDLALDSAGPRHYGCLLEVFTSLHANELNHTDISLH
ncbi:hypothetical protein FSARC_9465 [Fusarium sarcochroum]|uniref:Uncharacterized protein n=1 Tax=Fusarium sarcochroum TaxID=1208366 RepID=A0A8H4TQY1_9HYPO|nr:hypothetical protein FSARC_9465 [Fusarium sarcochroum]